MPRNVFSDIERFAFWMQYQKKCFYCKVPIEKITDMELDHLIPYKLSEDRDKLEILLKRLGIDSAFNIHAYKNIVPACRNCNSIKKNKVFHDSTYHFFFEITDLNVPKLEEFIKKFSLSRRKSRSLAILEMCAKERELDVFEMLDVIDMAKELENLIENPIVITFTTNVTVGIGFHQYCNYISYNKLRIEQQFYRN